MKARQENSSRPLDQASRWNGSAGRAWVESQALLDSVLKPFEDLLVDEVRSAGGTAVLDVGCGTGGTTLAIARRIAPLGQCVGVDVSEPMIAAASRRAELAGLASRFIRADAQSHRFEGGSFDMIVSRFGVMFFEDPIAAFANLRGAGFAGTQLRCIAWRSPEANSFMTTAERAAASFIPDIPARVADAPGQFGFADARRVHGILEASGWTDVDIEAVDRVCTLPESELISYFTRVGPLAPLLAELGERSRIKVITAVRRAFEPFVQGEMVRFDAACWKLSARSPG